MNELIKRIPQGYQKDIQRAIELIRESGCNEIYLFGSLSEGNERVGSDIDLAIKGCNPDAYFQLVGKLMMELEHPVDLINLDREDDLTRYLETEGDMVIVQ